VTVIKIVITVEAFEAIASTLPLGSVAVEPELGAKGERHVWLEPNVVNRLRALRRSGESYSDAILRLVASADGSGRDPVTEGRVRG
jgi:hypothetical protein